MKRPLSLLLVAVIFILAGLGALWEMVSALFGSAVDINFGVLALFAGIGLLRLRPRWRICALVFVWFLFAVVLFLVGALIFAPDSVELTLFGMQSTGAQSPLVAWLSMALFGAFVSWIYHVLTRHDVRRLFTLANARRFEDH